jgi:large subunit ribosomal protein L6
MSRIGKKPIEIPSGVKVAITDGLIKVEGPKGKLSLELNKDVKVQVKDGKVIVESIDPEKTGTSLQGLTRTLISNMIHGVTEQFKKELTIVGVGYRAEVKGKEVVFTLGYSHPINMKIPEGLSVAVDKLTAVAIAGADKCMVGEFAAKVRKLRPPEPYKGKGILYKGEVIKRKEGKSAAAATST